MSYGIGSVPQDLVGPIVVPRIGELLCLMCTIGTPSLRPRFDSSYAYLLLGLDDKLVVYTRLFIFMRAMFMILWVLLYICVNSSYCIKCIV